MKNNIIKGTFVALVALFAQNAISHTLSPMRLTAPWGNADEKIVYRFQATNLYKKYTRFDIDCFKKDLQHPTECKSAPQELWLAAGSSRVFKVQLPTPEPALYFVCTTQVPSDEEKTQAVSRVCSRVYVGIKPPKPVSTIPNRVKQHQPTPNATVSTRN